MNNISTTSLDKRRLIRLEIASLYFKNQLISFKLKKAKDSLEQETLIYTRNHIHHKIRIMKKKHNELVKMYKKSRNDRGGVVDFISEEKAGVLL